jgi:hypothetical protein
MKKPTQSLFALAIAAALFVSSCGKNYDPGPNPSTVYDKSNVNELFKEFRSIPEVQCVTAGTQQTITFAKGTRLTFYPNSFKDAAGAIITSGTVCIEMIEMYKPGDMISNGASTSTVEGSILRSGGQVHINATKNGVKLYANVYGISFLQPSASSLPMDLYYGSRNNRDSVTTWTIANTTLPGTTAPGTTTDSIEVRYIFDSCRNFDFINCDKLYSTAPLKSVKIILPDTSFNPVNTRVIVVVKVANAAIYANGPLDSFSPLPTTWITSIPENTSIHIVAITKKNDSYYYYEKEMKVLTVDISVNALLTKETNEYITARLFAL